MLYVQETPLSIDDAGEPVKDETQPDLDNASWIWMENSEGAYFRRSFELYSSPESAKVIVTGVSGFRLFVNGQKVDDDIGPWATWDYPKSVDIKPYLKEGKNVFAAWGQFYKGINVSYTRDYQGFLLAMKVIDTRGNIIELETDNSWKGNLSEFEEWETPDFDDGDWKRVNVKGKANAQPWGEDFLRNLSGSTTPYRPLSVNLPSPYLQVFDAMPEIVYDVKKESADKTAWYRFEAPPGVKEIHLQHDSPEVWVDGNKIPANGSVVVLEDIPEGVSEIAVRVKMNPGKYAGAAFNQPVRLVLEGGTIQTGLWEEFAMPSFSGIGAYKQQVNFGTEDVNKRLVLDLGEVFVAAEVFVNGKSAGAKVAAPYKFDLTGLVRSGNNEIEVRVANTLAPHYAIPRQAKDLGPVDSGLVGPVTLKTQNTQ
jgi:hypothetical protein